MKEKRKAIKTNIKDIIDYWVKFEDECELNFDWSEAEIICWRCGCERKLQRCHIIPDSLGGKDEPSNLVLLCDQCHKEAPNVQDSKFMWDWIKSYHVPFYNTFWNKRALDEYQNIYKKKFIQELEERNIVTSHAYRLFMNLNIGKKSYHFGEPYGNLSTLVGELKMRLDAFDKKYKNGKYKSDKLIQKEKLFEDFTNKLCYLCYENHWSIWEGSTKNPYSICISAFYPNYTKIISIGIHIDIKGHYKICYSSEPNPNNISLINYSIDLGTNVEQVVKQIGEEVIIYNQKYGEPDLDTVYFVSDPIWSNSSSTNSSNSSISS